jgi:hypothetical protein
MNTRFLALILAGALASGAAFAQGKGKSWDDEAKGKGKGKGSAQAEKGKGAKGKKHFEVTHRTVIQDWYAEEFRAGRCPPGLAKKRNGCMPPGQAKKWQVGQALPRDVVFYDLPPAIVVKIGVPPPGYKYVRVAGDILMIAVGTSMVVDAITDLSRL